MVPLDQSPVKPAGKVMAVTFKAALPVLEMVKSLTAISPTFVSAKDSISGREITLPAVVAAVPLPVTVSVFLPLPALDSTVIVPV